MAETRRVIVIGIDPALIDFSSPEYAPFGLDETKVNEGLKGASRSLAELGYDVQICLTDLGETAEATVRDQLERRRYDCVVFGAGLRTVASNFLLFEKLLNVAHAYAPTAKICFNTRPDDTTEAVQRWL